ncbi:acetamidase/formamidase [Paraburkholderia sp. BL6669N2]|uniref:acetamidase/formamidase family protein n=1 Tax=Paraburkholderia sp. BL6669N2 TaxID=1938807 RepID=UPI000E269882|nr:acetamidase/formamidase family protein [Paraburkholderia sp. BL6669N2]REG49122.1 acetamidase/formamidase [Paraburkholderia sp. BL6669N2]
MDYRTCALRRAISSAALLAVACIAAPYAGAQITTSRAVLEAGKPLASKSGSGKVIRLEATPATTQFGWYDNAQAPVLRIHSGDTVVMETLIHGHAQIVPDMTIEQMTARAKQEQIDAPGRGVHSLTGPVYVEGAKPGDTLKIEIGHIVPTAYGLNFNYPGFAGTFPKQFPQGQLKYFYLDLARQRFEFAPGIFVPLRPFPGIVSVARAESGRFGTVPPGPFGGNLDINEMVSGTTLYLPVFVDGGLLWSGDSHAAQGNGEVNLTALETAFKELPLKVSVLKGVKLEWPRIETPTYWIAIGYDRDLNVGYELLQQQTIEMIAQQDRLSPEAARARMLATWDCRISEVVNILKGTYCMVPKAGDVVAPVLPTTDNTDYFVTYAADKDLNKAMDAASLAMIDKLTTERHLTRLDVYSLASIAMDCRLGSPARPEREVHCLMKKSYWTGA